MGCGRSTAAKTPAAAASETVSTAFEPIAPAGECKGVGEKNNTHLKGVASLFLSVLNDVASKTERTLSKPPLRVPPSPRSATNPHSPPRAAPHHRTNTADGSKTVVALGKFDAMHRGHAQLATRAAQMGSPYLMSFGGMAEVLGWEKTLPVVAKCDRPRVCRAWAPECGDQTVR